MANIRYLSLISSHALDGFTIFAGNIQEARKARGWSRSELAERAGLSRGTVKAVEDGKLTLGVGVYLLVLDTLGLSDSVADVAAPHRDEEGRRLKGLLND